jgi:hypothetical protein
MTLTQSHLRTHLRTHVLPTCQNVLPTCQACSSTILRYGSFQRTRSRLQVHWAAEKEIHFVPLAAIDCSVNVLILAELQLYSILIMVII